MRAGDRAVLAPSPWGLISLSVCYDLRFAYLYRALAQGGASYLNIPAAFTYTTGKAHWHVLVRARAIETGSYGVRRQPGRHPCRGPPHLGPRADREPLGARCWPTSGERAGFIAADIDPAKVAGGARHDPGAQA